MNYYPDVWVMLEFKSKEYGAVRKIFAGWYGGYTGSDSWKLSSGNLKEYETEEFYVFPQESGSVYYCGKNNQQMNHYMCQVYSWWRNDTLEMPGTSVDIIKYTVEH